MPSEDPWPEDLVNDERLDAAAKRLPGTLVNFAFRIYVSDMPKSLAFYTETLGFDKSWEWGDPICVAGLSLGTMSIKLIQDDESAEHSYRAGIHMMVNDVDALYAEHIRRGANPDYPPTDRPWQVREYLLIDPNGIRLYFSQDCDDSQALSEAPNEQ